MAAFLASQLDYLGFLYGFALVLLGAVSLGLRTEGPFEAPWRLLAGFAFTHGLVESLALFGMGAGDSGSLRATRLVLHGGSFVLLLEFARRTWVALRGGGPGPWILAAPAGLLGVVVAFTGLPSAAAAGRLTVAVPAVLWSAAVLAIAALDGPRSRMGAPASRALAGVALALAGYGIAEAVPPAPVSFLPAAWPTAASFLRATGIPVELLRAVLVAAAALFLRSYAVSIDQRGRLRRKRSLSFQLMALAMLAVLALGWGFTERLGKLHDEELASDAESVSAQIQDHLLMEMETAEDAARILAGIAAHLPPPGEGTAPSQPAWEEAVDVVAGGRPVLVASLLDAAGKVVAASNRAEPGAPVGRDRSAHPYVQDARSGYPGRWVGDGLEGDVPGFHASRPIRDAAGGVTGVATVKKNLDAESFGPKGTDTSFIVSGDGRVLLAGSVRYGGRSLWGGGATTPRGSASPLLDHPVQGTDRVLLDGERHVAVRRSLPGTDWSVVTLKRLTGQAVNRLLGIVITFLISLVLVAFFVVLEWQFGAESRAVDRHREAEGRARALARRADTDALTGILNRFGFNEAFSREFSRAMRYRQPLSVVIVDLDRFKEVNDRHGHPAGDRVLAGAARLLESNVRESDSVARWGGEEFAILAPMTDAAGAAMLAEKIRCLLEVTHLGPTGSVTASFGVTEMRPEDTVDAMLHRADQALYRAKESGRNRVTCAEAWVDVGHDSTPAFPGFDPGLVERAGRPPFTGTGLGSMDEEHAMLGRQLQGLAATVNAGNAERVRAALAALASSVSLHFLHEQRMMTLHAFPRQAAHDEAHRLFQEDLRRFQGELELCGVTPPFRRFALVRLPEWFRYHVLAHDVGLARFLVDAGVTGWDGPPRPPEGVTSEVTAAGREAR